MYDDRIGQKKKKKEEEGVLHDLKLYEGAEDMKIYDEIIISR